MNDYTEQSFDNSNIIENKTSALAGAVSNKVDRLAGTTKGITDGDTVPVQTADGRILKVRESVSNGNWYDTNEVSHEGATNLTKSSNSLVEHRAQAARLLNKPVEAVTQQDLYDVGNMQTIQHAADMYRSAGEPRWEAPLISGSVRPNLDVINAPVEMKLSGTKDKYGRDLGELINPQTGINLTQEAANDPRMNVFYGKKKEKVAPEVDLSQTTDFSGSTAYMGPVRQSVTDRLASAPGAFAGSVAGGVVGVADFLTGGRVIGGEHVDAVERTVGKKLGYDKALYKYDDAQRQKLMEETFKDVQALNPESYKNVDKDKAIELFKDGVTDPILLAQSLGVLVGGAGVGGAGIKVGVKALTKGDEVVAAANKAKELVEANKALSAADKATEIAKIDAGITVADKIGNLAVKGSGAAGYGATMTSGDIEEYAKNNNGELPGAGRILGMFAANTLAVAVPEIASAKFALGLGKVEEETRKATVGRVVGASLGHVAASGIVELPQETIQAVVQTVNQRLGTEKYKDQSVGEIVNGATADILGQGLLGAAGGVAMGGLKPAADVVKGGMNLGGELVEEVKVKSGLYEPAGVEAKRETYNATDYSGIAEEDRAEKTKDVIDYTTLMIVDPNEAKANGYERGRVNLADVVDRVAKINGIAEENKEFIYKDVMEGIKSTLSRNSKASSSEKMEVFKGLVEETEGNKAASKAVENAVEDLVAEEMETVSAKISDAFGKHIDLSTVKISEEEMAKINRVVEQLRMMGSEELTDKAKAIEDVIKGLGKKKTYAEVRNDIKKAGFIFFGKSYKSLEAHEDDISREIAIGKDTRESEKLAEFVKNREMTNRVRFSKESDGVIKDRNLSELKAFVEINNADNKDILKTIEGLLVKAKDGTRTKEILEASKESLEKTIAKYEGMSKASNVDEFKEIYSGKEVKPKVEEVKEDIEAKQKAFVAKIINKSDSVDQALAVLNTSKNIHKVPVEVRSNLEDIIRTAEKFKEEAKEKKPEVVREIPKVEEAKETVKEVSKKQEPKVVDKELERVSKPVADVETTMTDLEYYTQAENWSKEANEKAKADLKATNERLREIYRELDVISSEKEHVKKAIGDVKEKIRTISRKIRETNKKLDKYDSLSWKAVAEVMNGIKKMIKDTYKLLYRLLKAKAIKEYRAERFFKTLERLNEDKSQLLEELKSLKETKAEQKAVVESEAQELREVRRQLAEAKKIVFGATYGEESAKLFKKVDDEKVTVTNKFSEEFLKIQESNSRVGQTNDKKRVIEEATGRIAEELVGLMPKSVLRIMDKKPEFIKNAMKTFMDYRYGTNKKINVPVQSKGSALEFLNDWLKNPELNNRLHVALDVVGMTTIDDMMGVRTLNSSMLEDMIEGAFGVRSDEPAFKIIKRDLQKGKYVPMSTFTKEAGARVVRELGLKFDNEQLSMQDKQDVQFALGQLVIERAKLQMSEEIGPKTIGISASSITLKREDGQVMSAEITKGYEEGRDTTDIKRVVDLSGVQNVRGLREVTSVLEYAGEQSDGELKFEPTVIKEGTKVRNSNVEMSKDAVEYINRNNKIAWKFSDEFKELLVKATEEAKRKGTSVNELMYELILDDVNKLGEKTVDDVESELAKREAEKLEIDRMLMGYELAGSNEFYLDWDQTISGRYMIANKMINPQNSKIVRFLVQTDDMKSVLTRGENGYSGKDIAVVKGAIAQAFGYGIDKDSDANVFVKMAKELVGINENGTEVTFPKDSKLKEAVKKYKEIDIVGAVRVLKDMGLEVNERMHAMQALKVLSGLEQGKKTINHGLVVEVDAITNGMILTLMEEGSEESMEMLVKGGIYWGNNYGKYRNHGEFKQDGGVDIYQTPVETLVGKMNRGTVIGNMLVELLSKDGKPDMGKWRNALKALVMVYIYGAGMKSIISKAGTEFSELLMRSYIKNGDFESMSVLLNEAGINTKSMEFVDKKRLVGGTLTVTKGVLSKANMGNVRLTPYQNYQLSSKIVESMGQAIEESFEENFEAISKYRKVLKTVEVMNYVVFKQELDRLAGDRESITVAELDKVLEKMQKEGTYYGARNSSGSIQDYVKLGDSGSKAIKVTGFRNKAATGSTSEITVNSALKWFVSNIGAVGVTAIHDKDGRVMEESDQDGTLNVYDAKIMPANFKVSNENSIRMNQAIVDVSREHSVLAEAVEKLDRLLKKVDTGKISRELTEEIINDMNRVFGEGEWISGVGLVEQLKELRDNRTNNVGKPMDVNHVYALDSLDGVKAGESEVRTIELTDAEIEGLGKVYEELVGKVTKNVQEKELEKDIDERLERQGMSQENKSIIDNELKKADTNILSVIRQLVEGCK